MTLARSLLLRLSGNSWIIVFSLFLLLPACKTQDTGGPDTVVIPDGPGSTDPIPSDSSVVIDGGDTSVIVDTGSSRPLKHPDEIRIAMLLPLYLDTLYEINQELRKNKSREEPLEVRLANDARQSMDFYLGYVKALSGLRAKDIKVELTLFDTKNDPAVTQSILDTAGLISYNMIIGPMFNSSARLIADYARENKVWHVLPFSPSASITSANPYHLKINPSIGVHLKKLVEFIGERYPGNTILVPYQTDVSTEIQLKDEIIRLVDIHNINHPDSPLTVDPIGVYEEEGRRTFSISGYLSSADSNVVLLPSFDPGFIQNITRQLNKSAEKDFSITLFGMPNWLSYEDLRIDYLVSLNYHFTREYDLQVEDEVYESLLKTYKQEMNGIPSDYHFLGYDLGRYLTELWISYGHNFSAQMEKEAYEGLYGNYRLAPQFKKALDGDALELDLYENEELFIFKIKDYEVIPALEE